jgi:hypothetical protein
MKDDLAGRVEALLSLPGINGVRIESWGHRVGKRQFMGVLTYAGEYVNEGAVSSYHTADTIMDVVGMLEVEAAKPVVLDSPDGTTLDVLRKVNPEHARHGIVRRLTDSGIETRCRFVCECGEIIEVTHKQLIRAAWDKSLEAKAKTAE